MISFSTHLPEMAAQICVLIFAFLACLAAVWDLRSFTIPNSISIAVAALWPVYAIAAGLGLEAMAYAGTIAVGVLFVGMLGWSRGWVGGGDVKLFSAFALWAGPVGLIPLVVHTGIAGGVLSLFWLTSKPLRFAAVRAGLPVALTPPKHIPYGVAIAAAAVLLSIRLITV
ncbi:MAG: prepilin peptidase [Alphaproteobacteria bacterium]